MKWDAWKLNITIFCTIVGVLISLQIKNVSGDDLYIPLKEIHDYRLSIEAERKEIANLKEIIEVRTNSIKEYEKAIEEGGILEELMLEELKEKKIIAGFTDLEGPGIILILDDGTRELEEGEDPNNVLVHDMDILRLVNDLKIAGAEAISINGQRLLSNSEINCAGHTIRINNQFFAQPFVIKAIGNPKVLEAALVAPGSYGELLKQYGIYIKVDTSMNVQIPRYPEEIDFQYLKAHEEGD